MAVMEEGSISHAAKTLHRVPSGVTARILQMEADLGVQLFLREKKRLLPTAKGQTLYDYARRVLALLDEAENSVRGMCPRQTPRECEILYTIRSGKPSGIVGGGLFTRQERQLCGRIRNRTWRWLQAAVDAGVALRSVPWAARSEAVKGIRPGRRKA